MATVPYGYWMGETVVTYELWYTVYMWATDAARGANIYVFADHGAEGSAGIPELHLRLQKLNR